MKSNFEVWSVGGSDLHKRRLVRDAGGLAQSHCPPVSKEEWEERGRILRGELRRKFRLVTDRPALQMEYHSEIACDGYRVCMVTFDSGEGVRVSGNLFVPDGEGPFPAVLNLHGHWAEGKVAKAVQARGHILAKHGFVVLSVDAAGAGERGGGEGWSHYHGAMAGGSILLTGDTLMGWQVRDNMRGLDVLTSLKYVDAERIGVTGASGGGNQTMWLAALDERVRTAVLVVSVGSFEAYVTRCNCVCETLPGGLAMAEEWEVLGLIAPRPMLIMNSIHDQPAFGLSALAETKKWLRKVYALHDTWGQLDVRLFDEQHGYKRPMLEALLGWMNHHLKDAEAALPQELPPWESLPEERLLCYPEGDKPESMCYLKNRLALLNASRKNLSEKVERRRSDLRELVGWGIGKTKERIRWETPLNEGGLVRGQLLSPRGILLPVVAASAKKGGEVRLILAEEGKDSAFVKKHWDAVGGVAVSFDLPATGELGWDAAAVSGARLHDAGRACLWLGFTLAAEWAECLAAMAEALRQDFDKVTVVAEGGAAFAALIAGALSEGAWELEEHDMPMSLESLFHQKDGSYVWIVPGLAIWGDLSDLRELKVL